MDLVGLSFSLMAVIKVTVLPVVPKWFGRSRGRLKCRLRGLRMILRLLIYLRAYAGAGCVKL